MKESLEQKYNRIYSNNKVTYTMEPDSTVKLSLKYKRSGKVLELGAGEGRNSLFLANKGFSVTAIDLSSIGLNKLRQNLENLKLKAEIIVRDIRTMPLKDDYDLIVSTATLFHLTTPEANSLIQRIKNHTTTGGLNAITTFTKDSDFYKSEVNENNFYPSPGEFKTMYKSWEILSYEETKIEVKKKKLDGSFMINTVAKLLARKPDVK